MLFIYLDRAVVRALSGHVGPSHRIFVMPPRPAHSNGHLHKKRRPVSIVSSRESSISPSRQNFPQSITGPVTWGSNKAYLPYHGEEYARALTIPLPHHHSTTEETTAAQEDLYGVPVLADQAVFDSPLEASKRSPYLKRIFRKESKKPSGPRVSPPSSYPTELVGVTVDQRQDLAAHGRRASQDAMDTDDEPLLHRTHKPKKSVSWDPELGSTSSSSGRPAIDPSSTETLITLASSDATSTASDKTLWPFPRKPSSLSDKRPRPRTPPRSEPRSQDPPDETPAFTGFEFTPRTYVPLWRPSDSNPDPPLELPTTPEPSPSRHRRSSSICHRSTKPSGPLMPPPAFTEPQLSPSPFRASGSEPASWPTLPAFGTAKIYTPPSPFEHSIVEFAQQQELQAGVEGSSMVQWKPVDFREGEGEGSPSRTLQYAAADWLRTR